MVTGSDGILGRCRNQFSQLLNVHGVYDVRQTETHTAETLVTEPSALEFEVAVEKLKRYISQGIDQTPAESIKQGIEKCSEIHKLINSIWTKALHEKWKIRSLYLTIRTMVKQIIVVTEACPFFQLHTKL